MRIVRDDDEPPGPPGRYEVRDHPSLGGLVVIWWIPAAGPPSATNMTLGAERVPLLAEALDAYLRGAGPGMLTHGWLLSRTNINVPIISTIRADQDGFDGARAELGRVRVAVMLRACGLL